MSENTTENDTSNAVGGQLDAIVIRRIDGTEFNTIFLQSLEGVICDESTWCAEKINGDDIEYIRADEILAAIGFRDHEVGLINNICESENISLLTLLRQSIRKFQGNESMAMTLEDHKNSLI